MRGVEFLVLKKAVLSVVIAGVFISQVGGRVYAEPSEDRTSALVNVEDLDLSLINIDNELKVVIETISQKEEKIKKLDNEIILLLEKIKEYEQEINKKSIEKIKLEQDIEELQNNIDELKEILSNRLRVYQEEGNLDNLFLFLFDSSTSLKDILNRGYLLFQIYNSDVNMIKDLSKLEKGLFKKKENLEDVIKELDSTYSDLKFSKENLESKKEDVLSELDELKKLKSELEAKHKETMEAIKKSESEKINYLLGKVVESLDDDTIDEKIKLLIEEALKYRGVPYVWGGTTPSGFDCSGYLQYIFKSVGVYLPRLSVQQKDVGLKVPIDDVKAGDLIFRYGDTNHIALYIGDGLYIHAPQTGDVVKVSVFNPSYWDVATRVFYTQEDVLKYNQEMKGE